MYPDRIRDAAAAMAALGSANRAIARSLGIHHSTVAAWRRSPDARPMACPRCAMPLRRAIRFDAGDYAELLGLYLGDGWISDVSRTRILRVALDASYPGIVGRAARILARTFPGSPVRVAARHEGRMLVPTVHHGHLSCLLPQHGPGPKHNRPIALEAWQQAAVDAAPWRLLRGLLHSDGCAYVNRTGRYRYLSWDFSNRSADILDLFCATCHAVGVEHRRYRHHVRVHRRASVALLVEHVGLKT